MGIKQEIINLLTNCDAPMKIPNLESDLAKILDGYIQLINDENELEWVSFQDILYIDKEEHASIFVTGKRKFKHFLSHEMIMEITANRGFEVTDYSVLVNMNKVKKFNSDLGRVYFEDEVTKESKYAYLSARNASKLRKILGREFDIASKESQKEKGVMDLKKMFFSSLSK